ncbi:MAG TPA: hypothetical protein ENN13_03885 [Candidatus Altiarchaeales archaeon]|nr:hypothetical protein [Candidatus Altiarchaeales archaeon]
MNIRLKHVLVLTAILVVALSFTVGAQEKDPDTSGHMIDGVAKEAQKAVTSHLTHFSGFFIHLLRSGYDDSPGDVGLKQLDSDHPVIRKLGTILFPLLVPFYIIAIMLAGIYYIWGAYSPASRASAKNQIMRLVFGMICCTLSLEIFTWFVKLQVWATDIILEAGGESAKTFGVGELVIASIPMIVPVGLGALIVYAVGSLLCGAGLCAGTALLMGLLMPIAIPYMIMLLRYMMCLGLGAMAPLTVFLLSFDYTKELGAKLVKMTLTWIFVPIVCAIIIVILVHPAVKEEAGLFTKSAISMVGLIMIGAAPMMVIGLMDAAGALVIHAGRVTGSTSITFMGNIMVGQGASSFTQTAGDFQLRQARLARAKGAREDMAKAFSAGIDHEGAQPKPVGGSGFFASKQSLQAEGFSTAGSRAAERLKRSVFGKAADVDAVDGQWMTVGQSLRGRAESLWDKGFFGKVGAVLTGVESAAIQRGLQPMAESAGTLLKGSARHFLPKGSSLQKSVTRLSNRLTGYAELDEEVGKRFNYGLFSGKNVGKSITDMASGGGGKPLTGFDAFKRGANYGLVAAAGLSVASLMFPAAIPVAASWAIVGGVGAAAGFSIPRRLGVGAMKMAGVNVNGETPQQRSGRRASFERRRAAERLSRMQGLSVNGINNLEKAGIINSGGASSARGLVERDMKAKAFDNIPKSGLPESTISKLPEAERAGARDENAIAEILRGWKNPSSRSPAQAAREERMRETYKENFDDAKAGKHKSSGVTDGEAYNVGMEDAKKRGETLTTQKDAVERGRRILGARAEGVDINDDEGVKRGLEKIRQTRSAAYNHALSDAADNRGGEAKPFDLDSRALGGDASRYHDISAKAEKDAHTGGFDKTDQDRLNLLGGMIGSGQKLTQKDTREYIDLSGRQLEAAMKANPTSAQDYQKLHGMRYQRDNYSQNYHDAYEREKSGAEQYSFLKDRQSGKTFGGAEEARLNQANTALKGYFTTAEGNPNPLDESDELQKKVFETDFSGKVQETIDTAYGKKRTNGTTPDSTEQNEAWQRLGELDPTIKSANNKLGIKPRDLNQNTTP